MKNKFITSDSTTAFIYILLRDHLVAGKMESILCDIEKCVYDDAITGYHLSNKGLGTYAEEIQSRLVQASGAIKQQNHWVDLVESLLRLHVPVAGSIQAIQKVIKGVTGIDNFDIGSPIIKWREIATNILICAQKNGRKSRLYDLLQDYAEENIEQYQKIIDEDDFDCLEKDVLANMQQMKKIKDESLGALFNYLLDEEFEA